MSGSLNSLLDRYLQYHKTILGSTEDTLKHKQRQLGGFLRYLEGQGHSMRASGLIPLDILGQLEEMRERGLSPSSLNTRLRSIKAWCVWMVKWKIIASNPSSPVEPTKVPRIRKPFLTGAAFQALLDLCQPGRLVGARREAMLWLFITSGIRKREMSELQREDLYWEANAVRIIKGKGQKERAAPFVPQAQLAMMKYLRHRDDDLPWLWLTEERQRFQYDGIGRDMARLVERAGLKDQVQDVCHIFRRTLTANAVRQGVARPHIMGALGWNSDAMITHYTAAMELESEAIEEFKRIDPFGGNERRQ